MTWLGKILTFVVLIASVVWMYFSVNAFVTRTNWKTRSEGLEARLKESEGARVAEYRRNQAGETSLKGLLTTQQERADSLVKQNKTLSDNLAKTDADFKKLQEDYFKGDVNAKLWEAEKDSHLKEVEIVRSRNKTLEDTAVALRLEVENSKKEEVRAKNQAKLAAAIADDYSKKVEDLMAKNNELRASGGSGRATVLKSIEKPPPPVLGNLRGEVLDVAGDLLTVSVGIDSGMAVGTVLDLYRLDGGGKYLGTVKVTSSLGLYPKKAIVTFTPSRRDIPLDRLPVSDLPKKGDQVRPPEALTGSR
jgi:hypothetical protein